VISQPCDKHSNALIWSAIWQPQSQAQVLSLLVKTHLVYTCSIKDSFLGLNTFFTSVVLKLILAVNFVDLITKPVFTLVHLSTAEISQFGIKSKYLPQ